MSGSCRHVSKRNEYMVSPRLIGSVGATQSHFPQRRGLKRPRSDQFERCYPQQLLRIAPEVAFA
jgi:hypothetical protein